jgi:hypothetical protein
MVATMAKPKKRPGPKPQPQRVRDDTVMIRCRNEWRVFLDQLAQRDGAGTVAELVERAVAEYATRRAFPGPIPPR